MVNEAPEAAKVELDDAPPEEEAQPEPSAEAEQPVDDQTESAPPEEETEAEAPPSPSLADFSDDDILNEPRVRDRLAREAESIRQKTQNSERERAAKAALDDSNVIKAISESTDEEGKLDGERLKQILGAVRAGSDWQAVAVLHEIAWNSLPDDARVSKTAQDKVTKALEDAQAGRGTLDEYAEVAFRTAVETYVENVERPRLRSEVEKEVRQAMKEEQETARLKQAEQQQRTEQPTDIKGDPANSGPTNFDEAEEAWLDGNLSDADYRTWREKAGLAAPTR